MFERLSGLYFITSVAAIFALGYTTTTHAQYIGTEAYHYGQIHIPAQVIADAYIEAKVLPNLKPGIVPLWFAAKGASQSVTDSMDAYFSAHPSEAPTPDLRQEYLHHILLLKQLRNALIISDSFIRSGDKPQQAALKAEITRQHLPAKQRGGFYFACYFENRQTRDQPMCSREIQESDRMYRDEKFLELVPLNEQEVARPVDQFSGAEGSKWMWPTVNAIDVIGLMLTDACPKSRYATGDDFYAANPDATPEQVSEAYRSIRETKKTAASCRFNLSYRLSRPFAIEHALAAREDYQLATDGRRIEIAQDTREKAENHPLSGFLNNLALGAAAIMIYGVHKADERAEANAANPHWKGHEQELLCEVHSDYDGRGNSYAHTYCEAYNGWTESHDSVFDSCNMVVGWCNPDN